MKKAIAVTCIAVMCAGAFTACSDNNDTTTTSSSTTTSSGSSATVASDIVASDPTMDYVTGDYDYEDCLEIPEYKNLELTKTVTTITNDYVSDYIASSLTAEEVDDADAVVEDGDVVTIECTATSDGEAVSSLSTTSSDSDSSDSTDSSSSDDSTAETTDVEIGSNTYPDGFDDKIIGMKADEEKSFTITVADDYATEELQGKDVDFTVKVTAISRYPELTDDWVNEQTDGEYTTLSDYQKALKESLQSSQDENSEAQLQSDA